MFLAACQSNTNQGTSGNTSSSSEQRSSQVSDSSTKASTSSSSQTKSSSEASTQSDIKVSAARAIELFQDKYPDTAITSLELDSDWGSYFYKIEGVDDQKEYEARIDAQNEKWRQRIQEL